MFSAGRDSFAQASRASSGPAGMQGSSCPRRPVEARQGGVAFMGVARAHPAITSTSPVRAGRGTTAAPGSRSAPPWGLRKRPHLGDVGGARACRGHRTSAGTAPQHGHLARCLPSRRLLVAPPVPFRALLSTSRPSVGFSSPLLPPLPCPPAAPAVQPCGRRGDD